MSFAKKYADLSVKLAELQYKKNKTLSDNKLILLYKYKIDLMKKLYKEEAKKRMLEKIFKKKKIQTK